VGIAEPDAEIAVKKWRYAILGWLTWKIGLRVAKRKLAEKRPGWGRSSDD
jgi:hypothetical protein